MARTWVQAKDGSIRYAYEFDFFYKGYTVAGEWSDNGKQFRFFIFEEGKLIGQAPFGDSIGEAAKLAKSKIDREEFEIRDVPF